MSQKQFYMKFYVSDYIADTRGLPLYVRGAWADLLCYMWKATPRGELTKTLDGFARLLSCEQEEAERCLDLLKQSATADFVLLDGGRQIKIISRRMKRDTKISAIRAKAGKKGGLAKNANKFANEFANEFANTKEQANSNYNSSYNYNYNSELKKSEEKIFSFDELHREIFGDQRFIDDLSLIHKDKDLEQAFRECYLHHSQLPNPPDRVWLWRQKFNTWLSISKPATDGKLTQKDKFILGHAEDFAKRHHTKKT